jgi:DNA polymerase-1
MARLVLIDGNSILNRAFYGIMGSNMLKTEEGTYTNAVYGFLAIMFKILENLNPEYMAVAFDMRAPTFRHKMYSEYKGTRKGMPDELAEQMPLIKEVLNAMNIKIIEKEGYEADDILRNISYKSAEEKA